jgi:hypothetical protein
LAFRVQVAAAERGSAGLTERACPTENNMKWSWIIGEVSWGAIELSSLLDEKKGKRQVEDRWFCQRCGTWNSIESNACRLCEEARRGRDERDGSRQVRLPMDDDS